MIYDVLAKSPHEVDIKKDSPVYRLNPHQKLGEVERVIFDEDSRKVTGLVIRRGFLFTYDVVLPAKFITEVLEALRGLIFVDMTDEQVGALEVFEEAQEG